MKCEGSTITFSAEDVGWQVSVSTPMGERDVDAMIAVVTDQIEAASGDACAWLATG